jgi:hypothetical protein
MGITATAQCHGTFARQPKSERLVCDMIGPFFFAEKTVTGSSKVDMLQLYAFPQLEHLQPNAFFQQDGTPPHWSLNMQRALTATFPGH